VDWLLLSFLIRPFEVFVAFSYREIIKIAHRPIPKVLKVPLAVISFVLREPDNSWDLIDVKFIAQFPVAVRITIYLGNIDLGSMQSREIVPLKMELLTVLAPFSVKSDEPSELIWVIMGLNRL
jgi:hypothetical protein